MEYEIVISWGAEEIKLSPGSPLRLLSGGLYGFDSTDFDVESSPYAGDHGSCLLKRRFAEREIRVKFEITEQDAKWRRHILSLMNPMKDCTIHATLDGKTRCIPAVPSGRVTFDRESFYDLTEVTLTFLAPDPFWMAEGAQTIAFAEKVPLLTFPMNFYPKKSLCAGYTRHMQRAAAKNEGDAPCGVVVYIQSKGGAVVRPSVSCETAFVKVNTTLSDGDVLQIDTRKRKKAIYLNGESRLIFDRQSTFFALEPGMNTLVIDAESGREYMAVRCEYTPLYFGM